MIPGLGFMAGGRVRSMNREVSLRGVALVTLGMFAVVALAVLLALALS